MIGGFPTNLCEQLLYDALKLTESVKDFQCKSTQELPSYCCEKLQSIAAYIKYKTEITFAYIHCFFNKNFPVHNFRYMYFFMKYTNHKNLGMTNLKK